MARARIRSAATRPYTQPGSASSGCHVDTSAPTLSWIRQAARTVARRHGRSIGSIEVEDLEQEGLAEWYARGDVAPALRYRLAERAMERLAAGDQIVTGDGRAIRTVRRAPLDDARAIAHERTGLVRSRLTRGDREALRAWLGRVVPVPREASRRATGYEILVSLLIDRESLACTADRLGLSPAAAMHRRSMALRACYAALRSPQRPEDS